MKVKENANLQVCLIGKAQYQNSCPAQVLPQIVAICSSSAIHWNSQP